MTATANTTLPMYDIPELALAHDRLWRAVRANAQSLGLRGELQLTQICGYPLLRTHAAEYEVVGAPRYDLPFCESATHRALIVVAAESDLWRLEQLRNARFALNGYDSNTGMNLARHLIAPIAAGQPFFREVAVTGSHVASLSAVSNGSADAASIDSITFALLAERRPAAIARVRILTVTNLSPTPAFVTPRGGEPNTAPLLFAALSAAIDDPQLGDARRALHLVGIEPATHETYSSLLRFEREAASNGYAVLR